MTNDTTITIDEAIAFLNEAARYFEGRPTSGEDRAHWSNVYNGETCRKIAALVGRFAAPSSLGKD